MKKVYRNQLAHLCLLLFVAAISIDAQTTRSSTKPKAQTARVLITDTGYSRTSIHLRRGVPARITFIRRTDSTCATEIVIPAYGVNRELPLNTSVVVAFTPKRSGEFIFTCGMNMMRGKLIIR